MDPMIRPATSADAAACAAVYRPYVLGTTVTFELEPPDAAALAERIAAAYLWLVAERAGEVVGYAYAAPYKPRAAYRYTTEVSIYLAAGARGAGIGSRLYGELLDRLTERGYRMALACIAVPNDASVRLHERLGFECAGMLREVGWKHDGWRDIAWYRRPLGLPGPPAVATPHAAL